ncbi:fatty acid desaturase family protein [Saccharothrix syringae]|uniref:Fatty acid desaturase n=1 Tax=Saccharothrix syringae TaxID=103733 RepID=A0A5Q0H3N7_SACSY|nr:fatty acid desaturase [Saccharothrix syringae]QFZ20856.1 fatty acid desaturase [Saccharothrix syringae]
MRVWRVSPRDGLLVACSLTHFAVMFWCAATWAQAGWPGRVAQVALLAVMTAYNIIVVAHLFTHLPWFASARLNAVASALNSVNIGQSAQAYGLMHVRNHHRYNNDAPGETGTTKDLSSTYRDGENGEHAPLLRYAIGGALQSLRDRGRELPLLLGLTRPGAGELMLLSLAWRREPRRSRELRQIRVDRAAHWLSLAALTAISWEWTLFCYLPAYFLALVMVNVQNYYRHYGADPDNRAADSVSHYGRLYNRLAFNDGYHQEHHLNPSAHWSQLPAVRRRHRARLDAQPRIVSPLPAMLGFLHTRRPLLHRARAEGGRS